MKKAQILSAIALAFALGVVAPVAGLASNASAYNEAAGTATYADTTNAIAYVENSNGYKAFQALVAADQAYKLGLADGTIAELDATSGKSDDANAVASAIQAAQTAETLFGYNVTSIANKLNAETVYTKQIELIVAAANTSDLYKKYVAIENILDNSASTDAQLQTAVREFRVAAGPQGLGLVTGAAYDGLHPEQAKLATYRANNPIATFPGYDEAVALRDAIDDAEEALAKYNKGYKLFIPLLNNSTIVTKAGKDFIASSTNITLANLDAIATNAAAPTTEYVMHYADWQAVETEINKVKNGRRIDESGDNYDLIFNLAQKWQTAAGNEEQTKVVAARMAGYKAPADNNQDSDSDLTVRPGNTGIVAGAEGTASTTVSIVAGLATALTALGAGVVVYRNARRSSEN